MPFRSEAQRRKFHAMAGRGEMPESTVSEWEHATKNKKKLPYKVKKKSFRRMGDLAKSEDLASRKAKYQREKISWKHAGSTSTGTALHGKYVMKHGEGGFVKMTYSGNNGEHKYFGEFRSPEEGVDGIGDHHEAIMNPAIKSFRHFNLRKAGII